MAPDPVQGSICLCGEALGKINTNQILEDLGGRT